MKHRPPIRFSTTEASWYYDGGATACGTHYPLGVAHKTLPCGTKVRICHYARCETAIVQDRGPFVPGRELDLNPGARDAIDCDTCTVFWGVVH